ASPDTHSPQRFNTTVPQQALFLLNSPFVQDQARCLLQRRDLTRVADPTAKIGALYSLVYGRAPTEDELALGLQFLEREPAAGPAPAGRGVWEEYAQALLLANEFFFVD